MTAENMGEFKGRDDLGRFVPGSGGRPVGSKNKMRERVKFFVETNLENLQTYFDQLEPRDKVKILSDLLPFCISKLQSVSMTDAEGNQLEPKATINYDRLSEATLKEILQHTKIEQDERHSK